MYLIFCFRIRLDTPVWGTPGAMGRVDSRVVGGVQVRRGRTTGGVYRSSYGGCEDGFQETGRTRVVDPTRRSGTI